MDKCTNNMSVQNIQKRIIAFLLLVIMMLREEEAQGRHWGTRSGSGFGGVGPSRRPLESSLDTMGGFAMQYIASPAI